MRGRNPPPAPGTRRRRLQSAPPGTSFALIDRALEARAINAETADTYRIFAAFGDSRLPAARRGDDRDMAALPPDVGQVGEHLESYSAATREVLAPFFMRPAWTRTGRGVVFEWRYAFRCIGC